MSLVGTKVQNNYCPENLEGCLPRLYICGLKYNHIMMNQPNFSYEAPSCQVMGAACRTLLCASTDTGISNLTVNDLSGDIEFV